MLVAGIDCNAALAGAKLASQGAGSSEHAILRLAQVAHGLCPPKTASCRLSDYAMRFATGKVLSQIRSGYLHCCPVSSFFYSFFFFFPAAAPGSMSSSQGKAPYRGTWMQTVPFLALQGERRPPDFQGLDWQSPFQWEEGEKPHFLTLTPEHVPSLSLFHA